MRTLQTLRRRSVGAGIDVSSAAPWRWATAGLLTGALVASLWFAPARWLSLALGQASGGRLLLLSAQGTVWHGDAQLVLGAGQGTQDRARLPGTLHWRLQPSLQGIDLAIMADCCMSAHWNWTLQPTLSGWQLRGADQMASSASRWPSAVLAGLGTPWNTLQLSGTLLLSTQGLVLQQSGDRWAVQGAVQLDAQHMSTSLSTLKPIGSYRLSLDGGPSPTLSLSTLDGSLQLSGAGRWIGGRLQFEGEARAAPERTEALANLLNIIGRRDGARSIIKVG